MKIIELPGALIENRKKYRHKNLEKNKHAYVELRKQLVPEYSMVAEPPNP